MDRRILSLAAELGMTPDQAKMMLIAPADMQRNAEGVFEVAPAAEPTANALAVRETRGRRKGLSPEEWEAGKAARRAARAEQMSRERADFDAARAATTTTTEVRTDPTPFVEPEVW
jgi:hypothetical protein